MSTTPATPELTINNSATEIKAALEAQVPTEPVTPPATEPLAPPAPPAEPQPFKLNKGENGVELVLESGQTYKGKDENEVLAQLAKAQFNATRTIRDLNEKVKQPEPVAAPQDSAEEIATREWIVAQLAKSFNVTPEQFKTIVPQMFETTQKQSVNVAWADFVKGCPDYVDDAEHASAIVEYLPPDVLAQQRPPNAEELRRAHALALYDKKYQPAATSSSDPGRPPVPPVMPGSATGQTAPEQNPWAVPLSELRKQVIG